METMIRGNWQDRTITIDGKPLSPYPSQKIYNHSPDGFAWGYAGSGPAQLALALLLHFGANEPEAVHWHQEFKEQAIATLKQGDFELPEEYVKGWIDARRQLHHRP